MKEFLLVFRRDYESIEPERSPERSQAMMKPWQDWIGSIAAQNKLVAAGNRLYPEGRVVGQGKVVTDGPYVETKEALCGYTIIKAASIEEASEISKDCPIISMGGNVEVRTIVPMEMEMN